MAYYYVEFEVAGELGPGTTMNTNDYPPTVSRLEYRCTDWLGDSIIESFPCYLVTDELAELIQQAGLGGVTLDQVDVTLSAETELLDRPLPSWRWLKVTGQSFRSDVGMTDDGRLVVSDRAVGVLRLCTLRNADVEPAEVSSHRWDHGGMRTELPDDWPVTEAQALAVQDRLRGLVTRSGLRLGAVRTVAGLDVGYAKDSDELVAAVVVLDAGTLDTVEQHTVAGRATFPYVPGLLAFREVPPLLEALSRLERTPDVLLCDGYGIAHPRRFGLACHLGVLTGLPSVGVAKTPYVGEYTEPATERGAYAELRDGGEVVGRVLRTQDGVRPVFVSVGHGVDLDTASELVLRLAPRHRLPETTRAADHLGRIALKRTP